MDLLNTTLGAVGQVGDAIDKYTGGRAVRGTLAGKPRELASIVPFSDTLGLTRPEDATSGRDLTDSYGLTTKGSNSFGSHAAGFVADNVLSPANWLGAGAALKAAPTLAKGAVGAAKALTGADLLDHVAGGAKKLGSFLGGESGSLKLPFDHLTAPPSVMPRSDPDWINGRTNYHGTAISDLDTSSLDPRKTDPEGLFGRGIYTTQNPKIAGEYSDARIGTANNLMRSSLFSPGNTRKLMAEKAFSPDLMERMFATNGWTVPDERRLKSDLPYLMDGLSQQIIGGRMRPDQHPMGKEIFDLYRNRFGGGSMPAKTVYQSQSNFGKILDLDAPPPADLPGAAEAMAHGLSARYASKIRDLAGTDANAGKYVNLAKQASLDWGNSDPDHLARMLKGDLGYDALTHTGGLRQGGGKTLHQVTIGLDPNDKYGLGRSTPYSMWEAIKDFGNDESGALNIGAFGSKSRSGLTPKAVATTQVNTAIQEAAKQFGGRGWHGPTPYGDPTDLAARFIRPPELPSDPGQAKQLADQFTDTMAKGRDSASAYFGPTYYDINNYLRTLGPEAAQAEVRAIREGRARIPGVTPPKPLSDPQKFDLDSFYKHYGHSPDTFSKLSPDEHGDFVDQLSDYFGPKMSKPYIDHFKTQSAPSTAAASIDNWDDTPTLAPSPFQNIPDAPASTQYPHPVTGDPLSVGEVFKMKKGKGNPEFVMQSDGTHKPFVPEPSKPDAFDEADFFGLPPDGAPSGQVTPDPGGFKPNDYLVNYFKDKFGIGPKEVINTYGDFDKEMTNFFGKEANDYKNLYLGSGGAATSAAPAFTPVAAPSATTGSHYSKASPLAKGTLDPDEALRLEGVRKHIAGLAGLIDHSALPQDMDLFRGVDGPGMRKISELIGAPLNSPEAVGREFVDPAFMSTAFEKRTADSFAGLTSGYNRPDAGVTFTFPQVPAGKPASFMNASENEVLFPPGRRIKITDNSNYPYLKAELYGTLLAAILGRQAAQHGGQNGNPGRQL